MAKKWTNERVDANLLDNNRLLIRESDLTNISAPSTFKIDWKCLSCELSWSAALDSVINANSGCPHCANNSPYTINTLQNQLDSDNRNITVLDLLNGKHHQERRGTFKCNICDHSWSSILSNITHKKQGCPRCGKLGRYNINTIQKIKDITGILYVIECSNSTEQFIKIGITKRNVKNRYTNVDFQYKIIDNIEFKTSMLNAWTIEQLILRTHSTGRYIPLNKFGGHNECYDIQEKSTILNLIQEQLNVNN